MKNDPKITSQIYQFRKISTSHAILEILSDWLQIFLLLALFIWAPSWWTFLIVFILLGARQYSLLILLHDAQHSLLSNNRKLNDLIAIWSLAAPFGVIFSKSRLVHIKHHQHLGIAEADPDFALYCIHEPAPKDSASKLLMHFLRQIIWGKLVRVFLPNSKKAKDPSPNIQSPTISRRMELFAVLICQGIIFLAFVLTGYWHAYFYLWILPLMTVATFLNDARIFSEHSNPQNEESKNRGLLISYISSPIERFFFAPHHMNYHAEHHFFPFIPHHKLPKVREILQTLPEYQRQIQWRRGYLSHLIAYAKSVARPAIVRAHHKRSSETI